VLFDAAGTLIRPRESVGTTYARLARGHGVVISAWRLDDAFHRVLDKAPPMLFPDAPETEVPDLERAWWRECVRQVFRAADSSARADDELALFEALWSWFASPQAWEALPSAHATLRSLRAAGVTTAVVSNFDGRLPALLAGMGLLALLDGVFLPGNTGAAKPDAAIFLAATRALGLEPARCIYVGDHPERDVAAARAVGMRAIDVSELATLADLPAMLAGSFGLRGLRGVRPEFDA
jgi:putative hydrolase of the HAD superfamily